MPRKRTFAIGVAVYIVTILTLFHFAFPYIRATALILTISDPQKHHLIARIGEHEVQSNYFEFKSPAGKIRARTFRPLGVKNPPGMVIVHGVHELGIQEPRLMWFATAMASSGILVLTPEVESLKDYRVTPDAIPVIGESAKLLAAQVGHPVGLMGLSFAGGLSLMTATDERYASSIAFVFPVGAHDDLHRVARFFATDEAQAVDGSLVHLKANDYGPLVLMYAYPEDFFPANDVATAARAIQLDLYEKPTEAAAEVLKLSAPSQALAAKLMRDDMSPIRQPLLDSIARHQDAMETVSPHGHLANLHVPVMLLHGAGDDVIPSTEAQWLAKDIPAHDLKEMLISKAVSHVEMDDTVTRWDKFILVRFFAHVLEREWDTKSRPLKDGSASDQHK